MRRYLPLAFASLLLAGCGGGVDAALLAAAVQKTEEAGGAELAFKLEMEISGIAEPIVMTGSGVEDARARRGRVEFDMSALGDALPGGDALCGGGACEMEMVMDGRAMYMRSGLFGNRPVGKRWMKMDLERIGSAMNLPMAQSGMSAPSASEQLRMLRSASGGVTEEGTDTIVGVEATHYSATVDLRRIADTVPEPQREATREGIERLIELSGQSELPVDVWIDDQDRVRRVESEQSVSQNGVEVKVHAIVEYVRFGVPVEIDTPSEGEVFDATALALGQLQGEAP